ncbi:MAG: MFS transporter [Clostridia bacterium]|nr:MFS transporter [Clostridia bacterium]MBQ5772838.1 MFS transporter [Clostridia bacterium]
MKKQPVLDANGKRKFGIRDKLAYAAGDLGCNMSFGLKSTVQTFWLVYMMMETGLFSILLLLVQAWDAINDPLIGSLIDNDKRKYRLGKYKTYILIGALGLLFGGAAVFLPFPKADDWLKAILFVLGYIIWDAAYTMANVPYGTMLNIVTEDPGERTQLSVFRSIGGALGGLLPGVILPMLIWDKVTYPEGGALALWDKLADSLQGTTIKLQDLMHVPNIPNIFFDENKNDIAGKLYEVGDKVYSPLTGAQFEILRGDMVFWAALIMGIIGLACFLFMIKNITIRGNEYTQLNNEGSQKVNLIKSFGTFMKNRPAVGCTVAAMGMFIGMQSATTANTIMFATHFGQAQLSGVVMAVGFAPMFIFMPFATKLVKKYGKKEIASIGSIAGLVGAAILLLFPLCPKSAQLIVYMCGLVFFGLGLGFYNCVSWAMMGDAIDYQEWKTGKREESVVYALHSFFRKLAQGIGPAAVIAIMGTSLIGYEEKLGTIGQSVTTAENMCWLVAILYAISAISQFVGVALIYNIDQKTLAKMNADLAERNTNAE